MFDLFKCELFYSDWKYTLISIAIKRLLMENIKCVRSEKVLDYYREPVRNQYRTKYQPVINFLLGEIPDYTCVGDQCCKESILDSDIFRVQKKNYASPKKGIKGVGLAPDRQQVKIRSKNLRI